MQSETALLSLWQNRPRSHHYTVVTLQVSQIDPVTLS